MNNTWLITGSSSGIGLALVEQLLARGDRVAATLRRPETLSELRARYGEQLWLGELDVNDVGAIRRVFAQAFAALGRIDVVVSNAGYALFGAAEEVSDEQIEQQLQTNLVGSIQVIRACLPFLREQGAGGCCRCLRREGSWLIQTSVCTTRASGGLKGLLKRWRRKWRRLGLNLHWLNLGLREPISAPRW